MQGTELEYVSSFTDEIYTFQIDQKQDCREAV